MKRTTLLQRAALVAALASFNLPAANGVHREGRLDVTVDGDSLLVELKLPPLEREALGGTRERLANGNALFQPNPEAECVMFSHTLRLDPEKGRQNSTGQDQAQLDRDAPIDLHAEYAFTCANPVRLESLDVRLFEVLPRIERLRARTIGGSGQSGAELTRLRHLLPL
jgi:hypothetical protein